MKVPPSTTILPRSIVREGQAARSRPSQGVIFRVTDAAGLPVVGVQPSVTATSSGSQASSPISIDDSVAGAFEFDVRLSSQPGPNVFQIQAGSASASVTITGQ